MSVDLYGAIAVSLRSSYPSVTPEWVREVDEAMQGNRPLPHGMVGMFIQRALLEARGERLGRGKDHES